MTETQPFLEIDSVKAQLGLEDDELDPQILPLIETANRRMSLALLPVLDIRELESTPFFQDAKNAAMVFFRSLFEQRINKSEEAHKSYKEEYKDAMTVLTNAIKAQPSKDISKRSVLATGGAPLRHQLLASNYEITDNLGNYYTNRYGRNRRG